ncbi:hypothetical protein RFI_35019, partial [Reticulomyxa filosa]
MKIFNHFQVDCQFFVSKYSFQKKELSEHFQKKTHLICLFNSTTAELLICGGYTTNDCYSYHTLKKQYKYICSYPNDVQLLGHCVVQLIDSQTNSNEIHLLSFGGQGKNKMKQTFSMKYKSVWEINTIIGKLEDDLIGVRGLIGGKDNDLLFITYCPENIEVIDLKTMKPLTEIKNNIIPREKHRLGIEYHCF